MRWVGWRIEDLGLHGCGRAVDVNERGDITGTGGQRAFRWYEGVATELPPLPGDTGSSATAIDDRGDVLGRSTGGTDRSVLRRADGTVVDRTARTGLVALSDLDGHGRVAGSRPAGAGAVPVLRAGGRTTVLSDRPGAASALGDRGLVVGHHADGTAFTWSRGRRTDIPRLPGGQAMRAAAVNGRGVVVGTAGPGGFSWDGRTLTSLPGLYRNGVAPSDITDRGLIVGTTPDGLDPHAVLLLPRR